MHRELKRNLDLEALRVVAIGFTVLAHIAFILGPASAYLQVLNYARFGSGVDLFFCISGFIITRSIMADIPTTRSRAGFLQLAIPFWIRRARRLLPAATLWIMVALIASLVVGGDGTFPTMAKAIKGAAAATLQYFNGYWLTCRAENTCGALGAYWSLSLENQFYFVLPVAAAIFTRRWLPVLFVIGFLAQFFIARNITQPETLTPWVFRTDAICLGVLLAFWKDHKTYADVQPRVFVRRGVGITAFTCLCVALAAFTHPRPWISIQTGLVALVSGTLVWVASYDQGYLVSSRWARSVVSHIGARSYSVYLSHVFVLYALRDVFSRFGWFGGDHDVTIVLCFLCLTWLLAELSYRFVERPMLPKRRTEQNQPSVTTMVGGTSVDHGPSIQ
jgi:peptidoglycan/LPS O-acetylase OafA/YrhL